MSHHGHEIGVRVIYECQLEVIKGVELNPKHKEKAMNQAQIKGKFNQLSGKIKETWGRLSADDIALANGKRDQFFGKVEEIYGTAKEDAQNQLTELERSCRTNSDKAA
jgi:uncharacterized protein YjbJ (UPF0337 family)